MRQASKEKKRIVQEGYRRWKNTQEYTPCTAEDKPDYLATCGVYHRCDGLAERGERIRRNENEHGDRRWVLHRTGCICGEFVSSCPYCAAKLNEGEGELYLLRANGYQFREKNYRSYYGLDEVDGNGE